MEKNIPTEYTAVPPSAYPPTVPDTEEEEYQPVPLSHPLIGPEPLPPYVHPSKLLTNKINSQLGTSIIAFYSYLYTNSCITKVVKLTDGRCKLAIVT